MLCDGTENIWCHLTVTVWRWFPPFCPWPFQKKEERVAMRPKKLYTHNCVCVCNVYGRNTTCEEEKLWSEYGPRHSTGKKGRVALRPKILYTHIPVYVYTMSMVATKFFLFFLWSAAGRIHFIILKQAAGLSKFDRGLDLTCGPDFGHACVRAF